jgi:hypothetical protein
MMERVEVKWEIAFGQSKASKIIISGLGRVCRGG